MTDDGEVGRMREDERRRFQRMQANCVVEISLRQDHRQHRCDGRLTELSLGGGLLELDATYSVGSRLTLRFWLSDHSDVLCTGIVRCLRDGQGDWQGWDGDNTWTAFVTQVQAHGGLQSVDIRTDADLVHPFSGYSSGVWNLSVWQYVPAGFTGANGSYFIVQKEYNDGGPYQWSIQMQTHDDGSIHCDCGAEDNGNPMNWIPDAWNHIEAEIDLDGDSVTLWYNGSELGTYPWTTGVFGNDSGCPLGGCIGAIDLFAFGTTSVYYDDFDLSQASECGTSCEGDANSDGTVDPLDAGFVLARFGCNVGTGDSGCDDADQNCDGAVDPLDSGFVLARFGPCD